VEDTLLVLFLLYSSIVDVKKIMRRGRERAQHKGGCRFGMLLLNLCTWEQHCLA
jgi:hypothetical protein